MIQIDLPLPQYCNECVVRNNCIEYIYHDTKPFEDGCLVQNKEIISCEDCKYFNIKFKDRYCSLLQINWLPLNFSCNKGIKRKKRNKKDNNENS